MKNYKITYAYPGEGLNVFHFISVKADTRINAIIKAKEKLLLSDTRFPNIYRAE